MDCEFAVSLGKTSLNSILRPYLKQEEEEEEKRLKQQRNKEVHFATLKNFKSRELRFEYNINF